MDRPDQGSTDERMIGGMKAHASVDDRFNGLEARIERLEDRPSH